MDRPLAILCSGQGQQHAAMFDLVAACPEAEAVFAAAARVLGQDPRRLVRDADAATLYADRIGQILCCTQALAVWAALGPAQPRRVVMAGYSVGELAAWGCAGAFDVTTLFRLAEDRAASMDAAAPPDGGLVAILGLRRATLERLLATREAFFAIVDGLDTFIVGGSGHDLDAVCNAAKAEGARRILRLKVAVPAHTPLLRKASDRFAKALRAARPVLPPPGRYLLSGIDGALLLDMETGIDKLARQISTTIDWMACLESCRAAGTTAALELGPGAALAGGATAWFPDGRVRAAQEFRSLSGLRSWVQAATS